MWGGGGGGLTYLEQKPTFMFFLSLSFAKLSSPRLFIAKRVTPRQSCVLDIIITMTADTARTAGGGD